MSIDLHSEDPDYDASALGHAFDNIYRGYPTLLPTHTRSPAVNGLLYSVLGAAERLQLARHPSSRLATLTNLKRSDLIVATGGDVFTSDYDNFPVPAFVFNLGRPVALVAQTIGPFTKNDEKYFSKIKKNIKYISLRERESYNYIKDIAPDLNPELTADVAFLLPSIPKEEALKILEVEHHFPVEGRELVAISISQGVLMFSKGISKSSYISEFVHFVNRLNAEGKSVVFIPHVQEAAVKNNDLYACLEVFRNLASPNENVVLQSPLSASEYKGVIGLCGSLIGVRTHPTIASLSQGIPTVAISYSRKAKGIMQEHYGDVDGDRLTIPVRELDADRIYETWKMSLQIGPTSDRAVIMKDRAKLNFTQLSRLLPRDIVAPR